MSHVMERPVGASDATAIACSHCGLPVPRGLVEPGADDQFCCNGCRTVYHMIREHGLDAFYRIRDDSDDTPTRAPTTHRRYDEFADPTFRDLYCRPAGQGVSSIDLSLEGVHCAACVWLIEKLPRVVPGVIEARLSLGTSRARLRWDERVVDLPTVARALDRLGYPPHPARGRDGQDARRREDRRFLVRIAVAGACAGNLMLLAFALYAGWFGGMEAQYEAMFRWLSMGIGLVSLAWPGSVFFRGAIAALCTRTAHLDLPIALALGVGGAVGAYHVFTGTGEVYFDTLGVLVFLLLVGRFIQHRQQRRASDAIELLFSLTPGSCHRLDDSGAAIDVPVEALRVGDRVRVDPGETVPADGVVIEGTSEVNQALLTGESRPVAVEAGGSVTAGATNLASPLVLRVEASGSDTRVGRLMAMVAESAAERSPIVQLTDRIAGWFVIVVIAFAAVTAGLWLVLDPARALDHTVALLIVACPCALGLATPLTIAVAIGKAARHDVMIKGGDTLERLARYSRGQGTVLLDKTGTVTAGQTRVVRWHGPDGLRTIVAAIERYATHPVGRALAALDEHAHEAVTDVIQHASGITARCNDQPMTIGTPTFIASRGIAWGQGIQQSIDEARTEHLSPVLIAVESRVEAVAACGDAIRPGTQEVVKRLIQDGWRVALLSGDDPTVVERIGGQLGLAPDDAHGGVDPEGKVAAVHQAKETGPVVMIGDGVNDAAALAAADLGVAAHGGAEASLVAAEVYLARPGLEPFDQLVGLARRTLGAIRRALGFSLCYNATAIGLAMAGLINPLVAAIIMPISSFIVLAAALSLRFDTR